MTTKPLVVSDNLFYAVQPCAPKSSPILSAFTVRCIYLSGLFVDTHSDTRDKEHTQARACTESEGESMSDYCSMR